jgi:hypothetical protein
VRLSQHRREKVSFLNKDLTPEEYEQKESYIALPKLFTCTKYSDYELFVYTVIESLSRNPFCAAHTGINQIIDTVGMCNNSKLRIKIRKTLESLRKYGLIEIYEDNLLTKVVQELKPAKSYFIRTNEKEKDQGFTKVFYSDFYNILKMTDPFKVKIYRVYAEIMSYIFYNLSSDRVAYPNIETIHENTGIDRKSIIKYIKVLMKNKILFCLKVRTEYKKDKNFYARWIHRSAVKNKIEMDVFKGGKVDISRIYRVWDDHNIVA